MGEIDTKPIESVQAALSLFGEKSEQRKCRSTSNHELQKEKELEGLLKDLANHKVQLEAKDSACMQALRKLDLSEKRVDELSALLKSSEAETEKYAERCREASVRIEELESKVNEMSGQLLETLKTQAQLSQVLGELKVMQEELLSMDTELGAARKSKLEAMTQAELLETAVNMEKEKTEQLLKHVSELNEAILRLNFAAIEAEREKCAILSEKEAEIQSVRATAAQAQEQLEHLRKQGELMPETQNQLLANSIFVDSLQLELKQAIEVCSSSEKAASDAISDLNELKADLKLVERKNLDQVVYIQALEIELNQLKLELKNANEEVGHINSNVEMLEGELQKAKNEADEIRGRENEAQVEIALLKSELHKGRSKIAAAEAAEARAESVKSGLYLAVQQLAVEAEEAKEENRRLKQGAGNAAEEIGSSAPVETQFENSSWDGELPQIDDLGTGIEERRDDIDSHITISIKEYELLIRKADKADQVAEPVPEDSTKLDALENEYELEILKKELEAATVKIGEFRTRAEQAVSRAEMAEKAKAALEDQLRKWREQKQRRKAALAALQDASTSVESYPSKYDESSSTYQPLGKVLNMKF